jgi:hypothetical protein
VTNRIKVEREVAYGIPGPHPKPYSEEELDHLIPLGLGGATQATSNLWPQPADRKLGFRTKDRLEVALQRKVCAHKLGLQEARKAIALNWVSAYNTYIGPLGPLPSTSGVTSALSVVTLDAIRDGGPLFGDVALIDGGELVLQAPVTNSQLKGEGAFVGNVIDGPHVGRVYVAGPPDRSTEGVVLVPLKVDGLTSAGTYEGSVDVTHSGKPAGIKIKVGVTDAWWWAVAALLLGTAFVLIPQLWLRRWRPEGDLHERHRGLGKRYDDAQESFAHHFANYPKKSSGSSTFQRPSDVDVGAYAGSVEEAIRTYAESTWYFDKSSDAYKKIDESLRLAEDDAAFYGDVGGFGKSLVELDSALSSFAKILRLPSGEGQAKALDDGRLSIDREPALALAAARVLRGAVLKVGAAKPRAKQADECAALIATCQRMAERIKRYELWAFALGGLAESGSPDMPAAERDLLRVVSEKVCVAKNELLDAAGADALAALGTAKTLDAAYVILASLGGRHGVWVPPLPFDLRRAEPSPQEIRALTLIESQIKTAEIASPVTKASQVVATWVEDVPSLTVSQARPVSLRKTLRWVADAGVVSLALAVGIVAALNAFWFGKAWGTFQDYLTVIFVGTAAQGVAKGLMGTLTQLRGGTVAPPVQEDLTNAHTQSPAPG